MTVIRLTKEFNFEMAHALYGYKGKCSNIHGHSYELKVCLKGRIKKGTTDSDEGMVVDFTMLKQLVQEQIVKPYDHALVLNDKMKLKQDLGQGFQEVKYLPFQPTCENLLVYFAERLQLALPQGLKLHHLFLRETASSYAEWWAEDNNS
jgi:6-pyruvoyltetrahydropterin/6-carboxytetrahydropterin synthase